MASVASTSASHVIRSSSIGTWVGIDEAGYGPNLGPLVMTAVVARGPLEHPPDVWSDLSDTIDRSGGDPDRVWIDDSKRILGHARGFERLEAAAMLAAAEVTAAGCVPESLGSLHRALGAGSFDHVELARWCEGTAPAVPRNRVAAWLDRWRERSPFASAPWRLVAIRSIVVGPARFNNLLHDHGNKAAAHFAVFQELLSEFWGGDHGDNLHVLCDKHGGRHYYLEPLQRAWPDAFIERGPEGPKLSRYVFHARPRRLELRLQPKADARDGLVALASMVSKYLRERWMEVFNAFWLARVPELRPTAGYPADAARFREQISAVSEHLGLARSLWWRDR